jgi:hypothetical protein
MEGMPNAGARCVIVVLAICSWLAISNHCTFAAVATKSEQAESECPFHSKPAKPQNPSPGIQCCKILRAVVPVVTKSWARDDAKFSDFDLHSKECAFIAYLHNTPPPLLLDTGPPGKTAFAELVRTSPGRAPPFFV